MVVITSMEKNLKYIEMSFQLKPKHAVEEGIKPELGSCVMLMANTVTRNGTYFPFESVEKTISMWDGLPININHDRKDIRSVIGHIEGVHLDGNKVIGNPVFDEGTSNYEAAMGFINSRFKSGNYPNVSIGAWVDSTIEEIDGKDIEVCIIEEPNHLALVVDGSCDPKIGCGIGVPMTLNDTDTVTYANWGDSASWTIPEYVFKWEKEDNKDNLEEKGDKKMSEDKTIEELQSELKALKKANLERQIAEEKAKVDEADKLDEEKEKKALYEEIKTKVISEMESESKVKEEVEENIDNSNPTWFNKFSENFKTHVTNKSRKQFKGLKYEELAATLAEGGY